MATEKKSKSRAGGGARPKKTTNSGGYDAASRPPNSDGKDASDAALFPERNPFPVLRVAGDGTLLYANPASANVLKLWDCRVGRAVPDAIRAFVAQALADGKTIQFEVAVNVDALDSRLRGNDDQSPSPRRGNDDQSPTPRRGGVGEGSEIVYLFAATPTAGEPAANLYASDITECKRAQHALTQAIGDWESAFDSVPDLLAILDVDHRIVRVNHAMAARLGAAPDACVGLPCFRAVHGTEAPPESCPHAQTLADGREHSAEVHEPRLGGDFFVSTTPMFDPDGRLTGSVHIARDITDRKLAEATMRAAEERLRVMLTSIGDAVISCDAAGAVTFLNPVAEALTGWAAGAAIGRPAADVFRIINEKTRGPSEDIVRRVLAEGRVFTLANHTALLARDGREIPIEDSAAPIRDAAGSVAGVVLVFHDVTEKRRALQALRASEERFRSAFDESAVAMAMTAPEHAILLRVNPAFCRLLARDERELVGHSVHDFTHPDDVAETVSGIADLVSSGRKLRVEKRYLTGDGKVVWGDVSSSLVRDEQERPLYLITHVTDITARKAAEDALREREARFRGTLEAMLEGCQIIGFDWRYVFVNDAAASDDRLPKEELLGRTMMEAYPGIERTELFAALRLCMEQRTAVGMENEFVYADGSSAWFELSIQPAPEGIFILSLDITARKNAEERTAAYLADLRALSRATARLIELAPDEDVYAAIAVGLESLAGESAILVSSYDPEKVETTVRAFTGPLPTRQALMDALGRDPVGMVLPTPPTYRAMMEDAMIPVPGGVFGLAFGQLPEEVCREIERRGGIAEVRAMPFHLGSDILGTVAVVVGHGKDEVSWGAVETFVRLAAIAIQRRRGVEDLRRWSASLEEHVKKRTVDLQRTNAELFAANEKLVQSRAVVEAERLRFRRTLDNMLEGCMIVGRDWRYLYVNDVAARSALKDKTDFLGRTMQEMYPGVEQTAVFANYRRTMEDGAPRRFEDAYTFADGTTRWFEFSVEPAPEGIFVLTQEITERKLAEQELRRSADRLRALAGELSLTEERERRRLAELLHDHLQQLLVAAKYNVAALSSRTAGDVKDGVDRVVDLLAQSIDAARSLTLELSPPILHEGGLAAGLNWLARWMLDKHGLHVEVDAPAGAIALSDDQRPLLFQAARELLFNVVKHAGVDRARVILTCDGKTSRLTVADEGKGFEAAAPGAYAETFGMFSIRERLSLFGGEMLVDSAPGGGTRVTLTMPVTNLGNLGDAAPNRVPENSASSADGGAAAPSKAIRVLLVDDHRIVRSGIAEMLSKEPDLAVVGEAADGLEAIDAARRLRPQVILMDATMPRLNGVEATRAIVAEMPAVRVIGLSMHDGDDMGQRMRAAGAVAYFVKDGPIEAVIAAIRALIEA